MRLNFVRSLFLLTAALSLIGCDHLGLGPIKVAVETDCAWAKKHKTQPPVKAWLLTFFYDKGPDKGKVKPGVPFELPRWLKQFTDHNDLHDKNC